MGNYCCCPDSKNSEDTHSQIRGSSIRMKFINFNTYNNVNHIAKPLLQKKRKPKAFNPFWDPSMPEYSINKDISATMEIDEMESMELIDQSHPSLVFGDLTAIINE